MIELLWPVLVLSIGLAYYIGALPWKPTGSPQEAKVYALVLVVGVLLFIGAIAVEVWL